MTTRKLLYPTTAAVAILLGVVAWTSRSREPSASGAGVITLNDPSTRKRTATTSFAVEVPSSAPASLPPTSPAATQATAPATPATAAVVATPAPSSRVTLPAEFAVLQTRNAFLKGKPKSGPPGGPEASLVLKGIVDAEARFTAFIEDKAAKKVVQLAAGEPVARGKIKSITLDGIEYEAAGTIRRIAVGQDLNGQVAPPTPTSKPAGPQPGQPQPGQPGAMPPGAVPPGAMPPGAAPVKARAAPTPG